MSETREYFVPIYFRRVNRMVKALFRPAQHRLAKTAFLEMLEDVQRRTPFTRRGVYLEVGELVCSRALLAEWCECTPNQARHILETFQNAGLINKRPGKTPSDPPIVRITDLWAYVDSTRDDYQPIGKNTSHKGENHQHDQHTQTDGLKTGYELGNSDVNTGDGSQNHQPFNKGQVTKGLERKHAEVDTGESTECSHPEKKKTETWWEPCFDSEKELPLVAGVEPHEIKSIVREYCNMRYDCFKGKMPDGHRSCVDHIKNAIERLHTARADREIRNPGGYLRTILRDDMADAEESPYNGGWKFENNAKISEHEDRAAEYAERRRPRRIKRA